jgi:VanZ family protein
LEPKHVFLGLALIWTFAVSILCLASFNNLPSVPVQHFDKIVHAAFHFGITVLWFLYWKSKKKEQLRKSLLRAFLFSLIYGSLIEIMQRVFTATRTGDVLDLLGNITGASIAALLILIIAPIVKKPT